MTDIQFLSEFDHDPQQSLVFTAVTRNIRVQVTPAYAETQSKAEYGHFVWTYAVKITNESAIPVTLKSRYWKIIDGRGNIQEVMGDGVVGKQPLIPKSSFYEYTSSVSLESNSGFMSGYYIMHSAKQGEFKITIPDFALDMPYKMALVN